MADAISTFVVDDDTRVRRRVLHLLQSDPEIRVSGAFGSATDAAALARERVPQLLLADIQSHGREAFDLLASLAEQGVRPHVIFITAHPDRAIEAFTVGAVDCLLKPFDDERLVRALARAKTLIAAQPDASVPCKSKPLPSSGRSGRLLLCERGKIIVLVMHDIEFVQATAKRVKVYAGGRCYSFRQSLTQVERRLDPSLFIRVHRSTLVNVEHLAELHPLFHGDYELVLRRGTRLTLSRRYRARLDPFLLG
jgi:two-component system LytT family response regulator